MIQPITPARESRASADPLARIAEHLFFIVGCGRSGTTLLQVMLANHPEITLPNETGFYSLLRRRNRWRWGELEDPAHFERALEAALDFWRIRELGLAHERVRELCRHAPPSWETLFLALLCALSEGRETPRVGEKSPGHFAYLGLLSARFPQARFLHLIRDPRAVACSYYRTFGIRAIGAKCRRWKEAIAQHRRYSALLGERYLAVRYEDLVREPERVLREVCRFLGCEFTPRMLAHDQREHLGFAAHQMQHMANTLKPVFTSSLDKWRKELSTGQIALVEHALGAEMAALGYELTGARAPFVALRYRWHLLVDLVERARGRVRALVLGERRGRRQG